MNYRKKSLITSLFLVLVIQVIIYINNSQKSTFKYFIWEIQEVSIGKLISISFFSGLIMSTILNITISSKAKGYNIKEKEEENDYDLEIEENNYINNENNNSNIEMPPQRDVRDIQPTISVNYRVIKNNGENNLEDMDYQSDEDEYKDDWAVNSKEW